MKINFCHDTVPTKGIIVVNVDATCQLGKHAKNLDQKTTGMLSKLLSIREKKDKWDDIEIITAPLGLDDVSHIAVLQINDETNFIELGGNLAAKLSCLKQKSATLLIDDLTEDKAALIAHGMEMRSWTFDKYLTKNKDKIKLEHIDIAVKDKNKANDCFTPLHNMSESIALARTVVSEPGNIIHPESLPEIAKTLSDHGVIVEVFGEKELQKMGFNALLGVGQGSDKESHLVVMQWNGASDKNEKPVAIVGKGVTFDTGGISIKPSTRMEEMKYDMAGSAVVLGLMKALAMNKAKVNAVGVMGIVENMPSGCAQRPGDIVTSLSGQTIEVINTDAEGRLVLADALWYTQDRFKPKAMVDLATLTGAIVVALGNRYAGLFSNTESLVNEIKDASQKTKEKVWHMPLDKEFAKALKADQADFMNSDYGVGAGSTMAAQFLEAFVNKTPWVHLDIAGTSWTKKPSPYYGKGATGFGIRLLYQWIQDHYCSK